MFVSVSPLLYHVTASAVTISSGTQAEKPFVNASYISKVSSNSCCETGSLSALMTASAIQHSGLLSRFGWHHRSTSGTLVRVGFTPGRLSHLQEHICYGEVLFISFWGLGWKLPMTCISSHSPEVLVCYGRSILAFWLFRGLPGNWGTGVCGTALHVWLHCPCQCCSCFSKWDEAAGTGTEK